MKTIEYKVRPVTRYIVTKFTSEETKGGNCSGGSEMCGEFYREEDALRAGFAMAKMDFHEKSLGAEVAFPELPEGWSYYPTEHASDCSVHNVPALPPSPCDCGAKI